MSAEVWGVVAAFAGVWVATMAAIGAAFFWVMSAIRENGREFREELRTLRAEIREEIRELRKDVQAEIRAEREERRADMQRLFDALYRHRHDSDGAIYLPVSGDD